MRFLSPFAFRSCRRRQPERFGSGLCTSQARVFNARRQRQSLGTVAYHSDVQ